MLIHHLTPLLASPAVAHPFSGKQQLLNNCSEGEIFNAYVMGSVKHLSLSPSPPLKVYPFSLILPCLTEEPSFRHTHTHTRAHPLHTIWMRAADFKRKCIGKETYLSCYRIHTPTSTIWLHLLIYALPLTRAHTCTNVHTHAQTCTTGTRLPPITYIHRSIAVCNVTLMGSDSLYNKTLELLIIQWAHTSVQCHSVCACVQNHA